MKNKIIGALIRLRGSKKRNFKQSVDLIVNLKNIDLKKPENRIKTEFSLPFPPKKNTTIGFFADNLIPKVRDVNDVMLIRKDEIGSYAGNKKKIKSLAKRCRSFLAEAPLMPQVGKIFGQVLAVRGKMPKPVLPTIQNVKPLIDSARNTVRISLKNSPIVQLSVGTEDMLDEQIVENVEKVISALISALPHGKEQIKNIILKFTMSKPEKIEFR